MSKIIIIGIGPGNEGEMTPEALQAIQSCDVVVGYKYYFQFIQHLVAADTELVDTGMKQEQARVEMAFDLAAQGKNVAIISSGDAGIYGMAPLVWEMRKMNPDFVTAIYNPKSKGRYWQLYRLKEIFMESRSADTPVGYVRQAGREDERVMVTTLGEFDPEDVDMFTVVIIGNSRTMIFDNHIITPRGYFQNQKNGNNKIGQAIMTESFRTIERELVNPEIPTDTKWALLHAIHTTADFEMEKIVRVDDNALQKIYTALTSGGVRTIVTDVTMAASGIRKGALERLGVEVKCYLHHPSVQELAEKERITRTQAGIRLAVKEHPDALYVFGNAPTALLELAHLIRLGKAHPCGIVAAPVGFVHVCESKHAVKPMVDIPKIIVEGRKGGSNLAATLTNAILCYPDAQQLKPGRDV